MKTKHKIGICAIAILLAAVGTGIFLWLTRIPVIAFYRLQKNEISALKSVIGNDFSYLTYDNDSSLYSQIKKKRPDLIFAPSGKPLETAVSSAKKVSLPLSLLADMTSSIRNSAPQKENAISAVPIVSGHLEIGINMNMLRRTGIKTIVSWEDIEKFASEAKKHYPNATIFFAGKNGPLVLDIIGALAEALDGKNAYDTAIKMIDEAIKESASGKRMFNGDIVAQSLAGNPDGPLYDAVQLLKKWYKAGLISDDSFKINKDTVSAFMQNDMASVVVMSLSDHRAIDTNVIKPYTSIYFPSDSPATTRAFTAPVIFAVPQTNNKKILELTQKLVSEETQESLSRATGLAPVLARCRTPDRQADDARYWVAATNAPLAGLSREHALSDEQLQALGIGLSMLIRLN